jgi:hypothetical protein
MDGIKERPIIFSAPMVRSLLGGTKTQTRRVAKGERASRGLESGWHLKPYGFVTDSQFAKAACPYGQLGDRLWVRESHWYFKDKYDHETGYFPPKLTVEYVEFRADGDSDRRGWYPSIHMPRWASRILLEITGVRVERLQGISEADALAEGVSNTLHLPGGRFANENYAHLWWTINGDGSWEANPWVWVIEFKVVKP